MRTADGLIFVISFLFEVFVIYLSRRKLLSFRYSVGWFCVGLASLSASTFFCLSSSSNLSLEFSIGNFAIVACGIFLLLMNVQLSISVSGLSEQVRSLSEISAIIDAESLVGPRSGKPVQFVDQKDLS